MADCNETIRELQIFLDGELPTGRADDIIAHLKTCSDCQGAYELHDELRRLVRTKTLREEMDPGFIDRLKSCFDPKLLGDSAV
ncbi:MAG: zf-HC2 domain-containing protein [Ilumatobacteraceae bacterium]